MQTTQRSPPTVIAVSAEVDCYRCRLKQERLSHRAYRRDREMSRKQRHFAMKDPACPQQQADWLTQPMEWDWTVGALYLPVELGVQQLQLAKPLSTSTPATYVSSAHGPTTLLGSGHTLGWQWGLQTKIGTQTVRPRQTPQHTYLCHQHSRRP